MTEETENKPKHAFDAGALLKAARNKKGVKQEEVARALRVPVRQVQALEHNRREDFPGTVYYRGALQSYCEYLDLDFLAIWRQMTPPPPEPAEAKAPPPPRKPFVAVPQVVPPLLIPGAVFGGLLFAAAIVWFVNRQQLQPAPAPRPRTSIPVAKPAEAPPAAPRAGRHVLRIEPVAEAWVRLRVDRKLVFEGNLPSGRSNLWEGERSFGLRTPRESALRIWLDGQPVDLTALTRDSFGNILIQPPQTGAAPAQTRPSEQKQDPPAPASSAPPIVP